MIAAGIVTVLFQRLKQPVVLGYIVAGILIGPYLFKARQRSKTPSSRSPNLAWCS